MREIILASGSPRRQELLSLMGVPFRVVTSDYHEQLDDTRSVEEVAEELGLGKALAVAQKHPEALVIGSDTIVAFNGRQLGKQPDAATARALLRQMSGRSVEVITSLALVCEASKLQDVRHEVASVVFGELSDAAIDTYLESGEWNDKPGAVAIQDKHWPSVDHIEGSYATVLGFATTTLAQMLQTQGVEAQAVEPLAPWPLRTAAQSA